MKRFNNNGESAWGSSRPDVFPNSSSRRQQPVGCRAFGNYNRRPFDDGEMENRPGEGSHHDDPVSLKLDRLLDHLDKLDAWRHKNDGRFENLEPAWSRYTEPPLGYEYGEEFIDEDFRQKKLWEMSYRQSRNHSNGYDQSVDRPPSCWDPHQRFQIAGYDKPERVKMHPPRFDGTNASNWISRVQSYFNRSMIPDAQRLHYAVMLFDQPAADWVFNYSANNDFVTWQDFLEDVRDRFDHQGPKPVMKERLQLHRPLSSAAAMARALELTDTHVDRTLQPPSSTTSRRPRDGRSQVGSTPAQQPSQPLPTPIQTQGGPGRAVDQARPPTVRVSQAEKAERARLGLCYYCPDKWVVGHVCKQRLLCYADEGDEGVATYDENVPNKAAHNGGSNLDVPNVEAIEEIDKTDNMPMQGLVGVYDVKIGEEEKTATKNKEEIATMAGEEADGGTAATGEGSNVCNFFRKPSKGKNIRKRTDVEEAEGVEEDSNSGSAVVYKKKQAAADNKLLFSIGPLTTSKGSESEKQKESVFEYESSREIQVQNDSRATATLETETDFSRDAGAIRERVLKQAEADRSTSLDVDARSIPLCNDAPYLSFLGSDKGRHLTVRYVFDPGGDASLKLLLSTLVVGLWFPP